MVATALLSDDGALAQVAATWAGDPDRIPAGPSKAVLASAPDRPIVLVLVGLLRWPRGRQQLRAGGRGGAPDVVETPVEPQLVEIGAEPSPEAEGPVAWAAERARLCRRIAHLESEVARLQAALPTRNERRRQGRQRGELQRTREELQELATTLEALRQERDELLVIRHDLEEQLDEAEEARLRDQRKARQLESQLGTTEGRAGYLQRTVERDLESLQAERAQLVPGAEFDENLEEDPISSSSSDRHSWRPFLRLPSLRNRRADRSSATGPWLSLSIRSAAGRRSVARRSSWKRVAGASSSTSVCTPTAVGPGGSMKLWTATLLTPSSSPTLTMTTPASFRRSSTDSAAHPSTARRRPPICCRPCGPTLQRSWSGPSRRPSESDRVPPPHYGRAEVEQAEGQIEPRPYDRRFNVGDLGLTLFRAGHILGAAGLIVEAGDKRVVITGDISGPEEHYLSVEATHLPSGLVREADLLVIETTYCHENHNNRELQRDGLIKTVQSVVERRGRVLIPAFGLGRSQEIVMILAEQLPEVDVLVDGLAREISTIYEEVGAEAGKPLRILEGRVRPVRNRFREIQKLPSGVIVTTSRMLTGGPCVQWAQEILPDESAALLLCGYQDEESARTPTRRARQQ